MQDLHLISLSIVLLPLFAAIITGIFGKWLGKTGASMLTITAVAGAFFLSLWVAKALFFENHLEEDFSLYTWGKIAGTSFQVGFLIDELSVLLMVVVSFVSLMVHIYTIGYMQHDPGYQRFFCYISMFTFGMLMLVMSNNFLQLFFGWEMVGLMSYLLIGFWYTRPKAIFANLKAFIVNRVGDFGFLLGIAAVYYFFGSLDYAEVFQKVPTFALNQKSYFIFGEKALLPITLICICLFIGAMGKSAQIPLHVWLPDSMEGPTPISALIHAATMVTAGVFMIARMSPLFEHSDVALSLVLTVGALTCLLMGLVGIVQNDIKRIIAYSTLSQLGYMMTAMGASAYAIGIFHLTTHAFFKALLFLGAGSVIIVLHHEQNIWKMGNLRKYMPITYGTMLIGSLALIGFPFFSGFYSKDLIIEAVGAALVPGARFAYYIVLGSVFITALYTFRLFFVVFHTEERMDYKLRKHLHESPAVIWVPLVLLAIPSFIVGWFLIAPILQNFFGQTLFVLPAHPAFHELQQSFTSPLNMALHGFLAPPFWLGVAGIFVAWLCYVKKPEFSGQIKTALGPLERLLKNKYGFDEFNQWVIAKGTRGLGALCFRFGDQWLIDGVGVNGTAETVGKLSLVLRKIQSGYLYHYAFTIVCGFLVLLLWLMLT